MRFPAMHTVVGAAHRAEILECLHYLEGKPFLRPSRLIAYGTIFAETSEHER
jgi:hypothetical protein